MAFGIDDVLAQGLKLVNKFIPDPIQKAEQMYKLQKLHADGKSELLQAEVALLIGQLEVNKEEAKSSSLFKSGWRPAIGWTCATAFAYKFVLQPFIILGVTVYGVDFDTTQLPTLEWTEMATVMLGMLGLGGFRSFERKEGLIPKGEA